MKRHHNYYVPGTTNTIDDASGFKMKRSELRERWDGFIVNKISWHIRQPQDFAPDIIKQEIISDARPPREDTSAAPVIKPI